MNTAKRKRQQHVLRVLLRQAKDIKRLPQTERREAGRRHLFELLEWLDEEKSRDAN